MGDYKHVGRRLAQSTRANIIAESKATAGVRDKADIRGHDLRRTAASSMASGGVPRFVIGRILNHSEEKDITSVYDRYSYDAEKKAAMDLESAIDRHLETKARASHRAVQDVEASVNNERRCLRQTAESNCCSAVLSVFRLFSFDQAR